MTSLRDLLTRWRAQRRRAKRVARQSAVRQSRAEIEASRLRDYLGIGDEE